MRSTKTRLGFWKCQFSVTSNWIIRTSRFNSVSIECMMNPIGITVLVLRGKKWLIYRNLVFDMYRHCWVLSRFSVSSMYALRRRCAFHAFLPLVWNPRKSSWTMYFLLDRSCLSLQFSCMVDSTIPEIRIDLLFLDAIRVNVLKRDMGRYPFGLKIVPMNWVCLQVQGEALLDYQMLDAHEKWCRHLYVNRLRVWEWKWHCGAVSCDQAMIWYSGPFIEHVRMLSKLCRFLKQSFWIMRRLMDTQRTQEKGWVESLVFDAPTDAVLINILFRLWLDIKWGYR